MFASAATSRCRVRSDSGAQAGPAPDFGAAHGPTQRCIVASAWGIGLPASRLGECFSPTHHNDAERGENQTRAELSLGVVGATGR